MRLMERPKKKKLNQRIQILHKFHLGSASCMCRNEEIYPFRLRNGPRIVFLAFHGGIAQKKKAPEKGLSGALSLLQNFLFKRSNQCASY